MQRTDLKPAPPPELVSADKPDEGQKEEKRLPATFEEAFGEGIKEATEKILARMDP